MNSQVETLLDQARVLPPGERAELLDALFDLVSPATHAWEEAWIDECEDRMAAIDRGELPPIAAAEMMAKYGR